MAFKLIPEYMDIYSYEVPSAEGPITKFADPLAVIDQIYHLSKGCFNQWQIERSSDDPAQSHLKLNASENIAKVIAKVFSLAPFDPTTGKGATKSYLLALNDNFLDWLEEVKKKRSGSVTNSAGSPAVSS